MVYKPLANRLYTGSRAVPARAVAGSARRSTKTCCLDTRRVFMLGKGMTHGEVRVVITTLWGSNGTSVPSCPTKRSSREFLTLFLVELFVV